MDHIFKPEKKKRGINPIFAVGIVIGILLIGGAIYLLSFKPPMEEQTAKLLEGSFREGTPEFTALNKDIIIATDDNTVESPMGLGTVSMFIKGNVRNKGTHNISTLEVNVAVITQKNEVLREKRILVVPIQQPILGPNQTIPITLTLDGFDRKDDRANIRWKVTAIRAEN
ncbi:MAG TPA: hypothetical protein PLP07_06215 [Pyrinomonadaceae bacterium]|jgi:hypothetical protein|nr:hypothetical protein [Chloracidobacterium sp.]HQX55502.1 hypothetical protein [Pyrinomonadaceae bacterium]MBK7802500.1 hypothetical protein [Chloracidobacterium sp.]MBK9766100.1 hypothetical protein [Chloracidobacterium sp.]MBL0240044.1 hypothetical protein [Chloracidobacterium sp.]